MKRFLVLSLVPFLLAVGCEAMNSGPRTTSSPPSQDQAKDSSYTAVASDGEMKVLITCEQEIWIDENIISDADLAALVKKQHPGKVTIYRDPAAEYNRALEVKKLLQAAGVKNVEIEK